MMERLGVDFLAPNCRVELPNDDAAEEQQGGTKCVYADYQYNDDGQIGEGTYGQVYLGSRKDDRQDKVALKKIRMDTEKEGFPITAIREIKILSTLDHPNIVNLREIVRSELNKSNSYRGNIYLVFDYADHDLTGLMERCHHRFSAAQVKCLMLQLLTGLHYCHTNGVLHRDLKASNLLIDGRGVLKIADFGLARPFQDREGSRLTNRVVTLWYRPPELLLGSDRYSTEVDMWSVGCIFAELLTGKPILPGKDETDQLDRIFQLLGAPTEDNMPGCSKLEFYKNIQLAKYRRGSTLDEWCDARQLTAAAAGLLRRLLCLDPKRRLSTAEAARDVYFWDEKGQPGPCDPHQLPRCAPSHEWTMKKKRQREDPNRNNGGGAADGPADGVPGGIGGGAQQYGGPAAATAGGLANKRPRYGEYGPPPAQHRGLQNPAYYTQQQQQPQPAQPLHQRSAGPVLQPQYASARRGPPPPTAATASGAGGNLSAGYSYGQPGISYDRAPGPGPAAPDGYPPRGQRPPGWYPPDRGMPAGPGGPPLPGWGHPPLQQHQQQYAAPPHPPYARR